MQIIIVTGSNSGIGKTAALTLAKAGHRILMLCRDSEKSKQAQKEIITQSGNENVVLLPVDLADPASIRTVVEKINSQYPVIDVLVNNAGLYNVKREETANGVEMTLAVNFLAPFMLSEMLLPNLQAGGAGRIINVSSELYKNGSIDLDDLMLKNRYKAGDAYANSKLATALYTIDLTRRISDKGVTVNVLHPGVLATNVFRDYPDFIMKIVGLFLEKPQKGGERIAYLAVSDEVQHVTGGYFYKTESRELVVPAEAGDKTEALLQLAEKFTGLQRTPANPLETI